MHLKTGVLSRTPLEIKERVEKEENEVKNRIKDLQERLTGDLFKDSHLMQDIFELKKQLVDSGEYDSIDDADDDLDEGCIMCGS